MTERNVVVPPFKTAGPIVRRLCFARSIFVPIENKTVCNEKKLKQLRNINCFEKVIS